MTSGFMATGCAARHHVVTGAATGIGAAIASRLVAAGARVTGAGLDVEAGQAMATQLSGGDGAFEFVGLDVTDENAVVRFFANLDPIDGLVNCAGIYPPDQRLEDVSVERFRRVLEVNLVGTFLTCRSALPLLRSSGGGSIVNISSVHAVAGAAGQGPYAASKGAIASLTRQIAVEYASDSIRANSILVGSVDTRITRTTIAAAGSAAALSLSSDPKALGRIADPAEIAGIVAFLLSDDSSFITASALLADGGLTAKIL
jgi:NAD(P)-dependent dehydrogenase (short-subunit alcohol dehydrogenase family)